MADRWQLLPYSFTVLLFIVMLLISVIMFLKWRNKVYVHLAGALSLAAAASLGGYAVYDRLDELSLFLGGILACGFIVQQVGLFRLYQPRRTDKLYVHLIAVAVTVLSSAAALSYPPYVSSYLLLIVSLLFAAFSFFITARVIVHRVKYLSAIGLYACFSLLQWLAVLTGQGGLKHFGMLLFFGSQLLMFLLLFERIIELMQAATYSSSRDELTGLYNRRYFMQLANQSVRSGTAAGFLMLNIDNFKAINETIGHAKGDETLQAVGALLRSACESFGYAGRFGGEEMTVMITSKTVHPGQIAEQLRFRIQEQTAVTVSIGYAVYSGGMSTDELINHADKAMHVAKSTGKNKIIGHDVLREAT